MNQRFLPTLLLILLTGCTIPLSTGAPQSATTVGKGQWGGAVSMEFPTLDLGADGETIADGEETAATLAAGSIEISRGVTEDLDVEVSIDGGLIFVIPVPLGASAGLRYSLWRNKTIAVALASKIGRLSLGSGEGENASNVSAIHGRAVVTAQLNPEGHVRPGFAVSVLPARITETGATPRKDIAYAVSATGTLTFVFGPAQISLFLNVARYESSALARAHVIPSIGLAFAARPAAR